MDELGISRGDICMVQLIGKGSVQKGYRPCVIISCENCNGSSPTVTVVPITSQEKPNLPTHTVISTDTGITEESILLAECITCVDKSQVRRVVGRCSEDDMNRIELCVKHHLGIKKTSPKF